MARKKAENGQELPDALSHSAEELVAEAAPDIEQLSTKAEALEAEQPAAGEKKETWYRVTTKNPVTKKIGPIQFVEGKALVPSSERWMLTWFQEHGYRIEKAE